MCLGIPGRVVEITDAERSLARVDIGGVSREVNLLCIVDDAHPLEKCVGDWVLVHVGFAMSRIREDEAEATLKLLGELGEANDLAPSDNTAPRCNTPPSSSPLGSGEGQTT